MELSTSCVVVMPSRPAMASALMLPLRNVHTFTLSRWAPPGPLFYCNRSRANPSDALMSNAARRVIPQANAVLSLDRHVGEETIVALASATPIRDVDGLLLAIEAEAASGGLINPAGLSAYGKATEFHFAHSARSQIAVEKLRPSLFANQPAESGVMASAGSRISALLGGGTKASAPSTPPSDAFAALRADAPAPRPRSAPPAADVGVAPAVEVASSRSTTQPVIGRAAATSSATDEPSGGWVTRLFGDSDDVQPAASRASQQGKCGSAGR